MTGEGASAERADDLQLTMRGWKGGGACLALKVGLDGEGGDGGVVGCSGGMLSGISLRSRLRKGGGRSSCGCALCGARAGLGIR